MSHSSVTRRNGFIRCYGLCASYEIADFGICVFPRLSLDMLAPKARQYDWFMDALETLPKAYPHQPEMRLESYPGLAYAKALCLRAREEDKGQVRCSQYTDRTSPNLIHFLITAGRHREYCSSQVSHRAIPYGRAFAHGHARRQRTSTSTQSPTRTS